MIRLGNRHAWMGWTVMALLALPVAGMAQQQQQQKIPLFPGMHHDAGEYVSYPEKTFYLKHATMDNDAEDTVTALRNMLDPKDRVYYIANRQAVMIEGPDEQLALAEKFIHDLDIPRPEVEMRVTVVQAGWEQIASLAPNKNGALSEAAVHQLLQGQDVKVLADEQLRTTSRLAVTLKHGTKIPVATEVPAHGGEDAKPSKVEFLDVGVNMDVTPYVHEDGLIDIWVKGQVSAQSGTATIGGVLTEPVIAQTVLESNPQVHEGETSLLIATRKDNEAQGVAILVTPRVDWKPAP